MAASSPLSPPEQALMDLVWQHHPLSVSELLEYVNSGRPKPITRNTLQTQLTRLEAKGWVKRDDRASVRHYSPAVAEQRGRGKVLTELKHRLFGGSSLSLVRCLVEDGNLSDSEIQELRQLIESHKKGGEA